MFYLLLVQLVLLEFAYPQVVINQAKEPVIPSKVSKKAKKNAEEFVEEQKELSEGIEEQHT